MFRLDPAQAVLSHVARKSTGKADELSKEARAIISAPVETAFPIPVVIGITQAIEALLLLTLGLGLVSSVAGGAETWLHVAATIVMVMAANVLFNAARTHRIDAYRTFWRQIGRVLAAWSVVFIVAMALAVLVRGGEMLSQTWLVNWFFSGAVLLVLFRFSVRNFVHQWTAQGHLRRRTVIVGGGEDAGHLVDQIKRTAGDDVRILGLFDDRDDERSPEEVAGLPKLGRVSELLEFARQTRVDMVIVSMPLSAEKRVIEMLTQLWVLPVDIRLSAHMSKLRFTSRAYSYIGDVRMFDMVDRPITDWNLVLKWLFDKIVAVVGLVLFSPIMLATAIAIKIDSPGPVFFKQKRHGFNNETIEVFKFRSLRADMHDATATKPVTKDDPRVTRVGRFIRKTSIDELPQFFNVLMGHLSVVGPRPHALAAKSDSILFYEAVEGYFARHKVKPGITGWAQINGWRGEINSVDKIMKRVQYDLDYIERWSLLLDLYIVLATPFSLFMKNENAY